MYVSTRHLAAYQVGEIDYNHMTEITWKKKPFLTGTMF